MASLLTVVALVALAHRSGGQTPTTQPATTQPTTTQPAATQPAGTQPAGPGPDDFSFVHVCNGDNLPPSAGSADGSVAGERAVLDWLGAEAGKPQPLEPFALTAPAPSFAIHSGVLTDSGLTVETWKDVESAFSALPVPLHVVPGSIDDRWGAMLNVMHEKHGGPHYSFDRFGCHFVGISTATPLVPLPSIDASSMYWLYQDLKKAGSRTPVFLFMHQPPDSHALAQPAQWARLHQVISRFNVVLILSGQGDHAVHSVVDGYDCLHGGTLRGDNAGYTVVSVKDGVLRAAYRFREGGRPMERIIEKPMRPADAPKLETRLARREGSAIEADQLSIPVTVRSPRGASPVKPAYRVTIDGVATETTEPKPGTLQVPFAGLAPGGHTLELRVDDRDSGQFLGMETLRFSYDKRSSPLAWRRRLPASVMARPLVLDDERVVFAETSGTLRAINVRNTGQAWEYKCGGAILGSPTTADGVVVFGSADGHVYGLGDDGQERWKYDAGVPVYGAVAIHEGTAYVGDARGRLHALDAQSGDVRWVFEKAGRPITASATVHGEAVLFGARDGHLYGVNRSDGSLTWKAQVPQAATTDAASYDAAVDCAPVVLGDLVYVCGRGFQLVTYSLDGKPGAINLSDASAIGAASDGTAIYVRGSKDRVSKLDAQGKPLWETGVPTGQLPLPPTERDGRVFVCSDTGVLSVLDAGTGSVAQTYRVSEGFYVMAPVATGSEGRCFAASTDGVVVCLTFP